MPEECVTAHFAVGQDFDPRTLLQVHGLVHGPVLDGFELHRSDLPFLVTFAGVFKVCGSQQASNNIASIHGKPPGKASFKLYLQNQCTPAPCASISGRAPLASWLRRKRT